MHGMNLMQRFLRVQEARLLATTDLSALADIPTMQLIGMCNSPDQVKLSKEQAQALADALHVDLAILQDTDEQRFQDLIGQVEDQVIVSPLRADRSVHEINERLLDVRRDIASPSKVLELRKQLVRMDEESVMLVSCPDADKRNAVIEWLVDTMMVPSVVLVHEPGRMAMLDDDTLYLQLDGTDRPFMNAGRSMRTLRVIDVLDDQNAPHLMQDIYLDAPRMIIGVDAPSATQAAQLWRELATQQDRAVKTAALGARPRVLHIDEHGKLIEDVALSNDGWFHSDTWQSMEREADADIAAGRVKDLGDSMFSR